MFWGLIMKPTKKYSQTVERAFHLSCAAINTFEIGDEDVQVLLQAEGNTFLLCTLNKKIPQQALDLNYMEGETISFMTKGNSTVHLTGFLIPNEDGFEEEEEDSVKEGAGNKLAKALAALSKGGAGSDDSESGDDDDASGAEEQGDDEEGDEEGEEDDDDDDEDESDDEESEVEEPAPKKQKAEPAKPAKNGLENGKSQKKDKQKENQKDQKAQGTTLPGGVKIVDLKTGSGPEAKPGRKVAVFYEGRLQSNNKMFDSAKGQAFKFNLGKREVIKGWEVGIPGMKVGGKRRITCPPGMAYGAKGSPPVIPANATLVFDVELKNVN